MDRRIEKNYLYKILRSSLMRIDDFLSTVGVIKRRTIAKELGQNGLLVVNGNKVKPAYQISIDDIVQIKGTNPQTIQIIEIPFTSVPKDKRERYVKFMHEFS